MAEYTLNMTGAEIDEALAKANQSLSQSEVEALLADYPTETELQTLLEDYEPVHETETVTGNAGSVTITNPLDAPVLDFTATGMGTPGVIDATEIGGASAMGSQTWDSPMILDVPIGIIDPNGNPVFLDYGGGVGANSYKPIAGTETGTTIWWNSAQLAKLFDEAEAAGDDGSSEGAGMNLFTWTLPFSVAENSVVYCSHLKNQNVSGEEGIWASGNHIYLRISTSHLPRSDFSDLAELMRTFVSKVNYYNPRDPKGTDPENWLDFWIMVTPSTSYTKKSDKKIFSLSSGSQMFMYLKISDYVAILMEQQPSPTALTNLSVTYLTNIAANITQNAVLANAIYTARQEAAALGEGASATLGGAIGAGASSIGRGGAVGRNSFVEDGGAVGSNSTAADGGAVGYGATTSDGCAIGRYAACENSQGNPINAIQLGTGTNQTPYTMQVYDYQMMDSSGKIPYERLPQDEIEPIHETKTVTGTNGEITITEALDAPVIEFSATGLGAPAVFYVPNMTAQEQGQQTWNTPLCLDVPIGVVSGEDPIALNYGGGIGNNTFVPTAGKEIGTTVFYNSRELVELFQAAMDADANTSNESGSPATTRFEVPLPFSVADGSTVYCSHLKNQNIAGEEGIWASGSTLYIRLLASRAGNKWSALISIIEQFTSNVNYYDPFNPKGTDPVNWLDFFICVTASANYTKVGRASAVKLDNNTYNLSYVKISDYVAVVSGQGEANLTPISSMSITYYTNTNINKIQQEAMTSTIADQLGRTNAIGNGAYAASGGAVGTGAAATSGFAGGERASAASGGGAVGSDAYATSGGAVGCNAKSTTGGAIGYSAKSTTGFAGGYNASATTGGAIGYGVRAIDGFAGGYLATAQTGGAIGCQATEINGGGSVGYQAVANRGGAIGSNAKSGNGAAIGYNAQCISGNSFVDAIQLGTGTNSTEYSMQVYDTVLLTPTTVNGQLIRVIPLSLITASYSAASAEDQAAFKNALGLATQQEIEAAFGLPVTPTT